MERIELPVNSALRTSKRASVDLLSPPMETVTGRSARCLWCDQVVFESQDFHGDFEIGWGASTETYPLDGKLDFYCHAGGQHLAQRRRHKIAFSAGDEVQVFDQGHWWGGWRVVEESEDVGNAIVSLQPDGGPEGEIHRWDISDVRFASKVASNPYSPEGNPYVPPPVTPGTPDEMLDGPNDPYPHGLDMPQINRPIGDEEAEQPAGTVSRRRSRIPVICVDHGHRFRVARIDSDLACHCGSLDIDLDVDGVPAHLAMEGDRPLAHLPHHQPQMGFLPTGPFSVPFTGQEPEATSEDEGDVPYAEGVGPRGSSFRTIVNDIITDNPNVTTAEAQRIARRVMGTYQPGKRGASKRESLEGRAKTADSMMDHRILQNSIGPDGRTYEWKLDLKNNTLYGREAGAQRWFRVAFNIFSTEDAYEFIINSASMGSGVHRLATKTAQGRLVYLYTLYHNAHTFFTRVGRWDDVYLRGYVGSFENPNGDPFEHVYALHNHPNRPDGQTAPSLSVGDVVSVNFPDGTTEVKTVAKIGFAPFEYAPERLVFTIDEFVNEQEAVWQRWPFHERPSGPHLQAGSSNRSKTADISPDSLGVKVGDIFYSSWGYEQTNVSFYEVVGLTGASVKVRPIGKNVEQSTSPSTTYVTPKPGVFVPWHRWDNEDVNAPMTKRLSPSGAIRISHSERAWLWDGKPKYETAAGWGH